MDFNKKEMPIQGFAGFGGGTFGPAFRSSGGAGEYIEALFNIHLRNGDGGNQTVTNGIDLSGEGGFVWVKERNSGNSHTMFMTDIAEVGGKRPYLSTNTEFQQKTKNNIDIQFNDNGYQIQGDDGQINQNSNNTYADFSFRKATGFMDIITFTGNGSNRTVAHDLGSTPGMVWVKKTSGDALWYIWHKGLSSNSKYLRFEHGQGEITDSTAWNDTAPTATHISLGTSNNTNENSATFIAYLFADDVESFGVDGNQSVIKCGTYTGNGNADGTEIDLGWEPQFLLHKNRDAAGNWHLMDVMRGIETGGSADNYLLPNTSDQENGVELLNLTSTGFKNTSTRTSWNENNVVYVYCAIRRADGYVGEPVTTATDVFNMDTANGSSSGPAYDSGFPVDWGIRRKATGGATDGSGGLNATFISYQRSLNLNYLKIVDNSAEATSSRAKWDLMTGMSHTDASPQQGFMWKRHAGFDQVYYYGNGSSPRNISHSMNNVPQMIVVKKTGATGGWQVYHEGAGNTKYLYWNQDYPAQSSSAVWANTTPTSSVFTVGGGAEVNESSYLYQALLFSSVTGICKCGSYTGDDSDDGSHEINVGFTPRFLIIKRHDNTTDWKVFNTLTGFPQSGAAAFMELNTQDDAYSGSTATVTQSTNGFKLYSPGSPYNAGSAEYIYYAHA